MRISFTLGGAPIARELVIPEEPDFTKEADVRYFRFLAIIGFSFDF